MLIRAINRPDNDVEVSPSTIVNPSFSRASIAPWDTTAGFGDYRKDLSVLESPSCNIPTGNVPTIHRQPPTASSTVSPWSNEANSAHGRQSKPSHMASSVFGSFYNSSSDELPQLSPGFVPHNGAAAPWDEDRRPSVASTSTLSSTGSKRSLTGRFHKKLQGFFGEDFDPDEPRNNSEGSIHTTNTLGADGARDRQGSTTTRAESPGPSRPRTPQPSSEVTPWVFQEPPTKVSCPSSHPDMHRRPLTHCARTCPRPHPNHPPPT